VRACWVETDEQAAQRTTASSLCLGGSIKHVAATEQIWMSFVRGGAEAMAAGGDGPWAGNVEMLDSDTLAGLLDRYGEVAQHAGHADIIRESLDGARTMG
jgi:hypothetical protein